MVTRCGMDGKHAVDKISAIVYMSEFESSFDSPRSAEDNLTSSSIRKIIGKKLQFITLLTAICTVSHIENSKNDKGYVT